ncbi:MAG: dienelactone hydrolase family protein [Thermoguttaceae bacterium]|nr:dienelactone hydrolase family protein [Thermoguttaceae bacterium]
MTKILNYCLLILLGLLFEMTLLNAAEPVSSDQAVEPVAGKQVLMKMMLPAPTGTWRTIEELSTPSPADASKMVPVPFWFFLPENESAKTDAGFPLLLFLHGAGERGDNPDLVKVHGPAMLLDNPEKAKDWPFLTVSPQCPENALWSPEQLHQLVENLCEKYPIDRDRIYVTGLSMGGFATWAILAKYPDWIAAAAPICGGGKLDTASKMVNVPVWAFHGEADPLVPVRVTRDMVQAIQDAGGQKVKATYYPGVGHNSWVQAYNTPELYQWLLEQKREK